MMLAEPSQKKLTTIASPWCGFVGLNPLMSTVPLSCSVPFNWLPTTRNSGAPGYAGATGSAQAAPSKLAPTSAASLTIVVRFTITPPLLVAQTEPQTNKNPRQAASLRCASPQPDIERSAHGTAQTGGGTLQRVSVPDLIDAQVRERCHTVDRSHGLCAGQFAGQEQAAVVRDRDRHLTIQTHGRIAQRI